jgi:hypothetical protein
MAKGAKYPRRGGETKLDAPRLCAVCRQWGALRRVDVQVDWFRGNDVVVYAHTRCLKGKTAAELLETQRKK